jgi:dUTPase
LFNFSKEDYKGKYYLVNHCHIPFLLWHLFLLVSEGDRIAQLVLEKIYTPEVAEVDVSK